MQCLPPKFTLPNHGPQNWFNGTVFANNQGVIVVTINYRLGPLGFLTLDDTLMAEVEARSGEAPVGTGGTNGLNDQRMAMEWVHANIEAFGGDPNKVLNKRGCDEFTFWFWVLVVDAPLGRDFTNRR